MLSMTVSEVAVDQNNFGSGPKVGCKLGKQTMQGSDMFLAKYKGEILGLGPHVETT